MENNSIPILRLPGNMVIALGRLIDTYTVNALIFGCPDSPMYTMEDVENAWQNTSMVWSAYLYRAGSSGFSSKLYSPENFHKAYIIDFACITNQGEQFAPHNYSSSNLLFTDCHVENRINSREPFRFYTAQAALHGEMLPDCSSIWQNADE